MEVRTINDKLYIKGYVNITDKCSRVIKENNLAFKEKVEPTCFRRAINKADNILFLLNHNENRKLGSLRDGNIKLKEDNIGLFIEAEIDDKEVLDLYNNDGFSGFSYGFRTIKDSLSEENGVNVRTLKDIDLIEVSLLDSTETPAYYGTLINSIEKRSLEKEIRNFVSEELQEGDNSKELQELKDYANIIQEALDLI